MKIIDIHSHILPYVDDGAKDIEQAINMLKIACSEGIRKIIATPHYHIGRMMANKARCEESIVLLRKKIEELGLELELYLGNEIYYHAEAMEKVNAKSVMSMADSSYVLFEFSPSVDISTIYKGINDAIMEGYVPIIAHFERYNCLADKIKKCEELVGMGALLQVNASSVLGEQGIRTKKYIKKLMKKNLISFVASDAHEDVHRVPKLKECYLYVQKKFGEDYARKIFYDNQNELINDGRIVV